MKEFGFYRKEREFSKAFTIPLGILQNTLQSRALNSIFVRYYLNSSINFKVAEWEELAAAMKY